MNKKKANTTTEKKIKSALPTNANKGPDLLVSDMVRELYPKGVLDRLTFDGYTLTWHGFEQDTYTGFSGLADESARESVADAGPVPQGKYAIDPKNIQKMKPVDLEAWGRHRVILEPYAATVERMRSCFKKVRTQMYVHGGEVKGTIGCIELNDDSEHKRFFEKLCKYGKKIEIEIKYVGEREKKYEEKNCPYI